jgi:hypothetical protein
MPAINVSQTQFERFQKFAEPFVDSHESAFEKVLCLAENGHSMPTKTSDAYGLTTLPDLKHTTITSIRIGAKTMDTNYWNSALIEVLKVAKPYGSLTEAVKALPVNISTEKKTLQGYKWYPELHLSVQGLAATEAAKTMLSLAEKYGFALEIDFFWQSKPEAANPGQKAKLAAN